MVLWYVVAKNSASQNTFLFGIFPYSSGPNKRVHMPIYLGNKIPPHMALLGTTRLLIFQRKSKKKLDHDFKSLLYNT